MSAATVLGCDTSTVTGVPHSCATKPPTEVELMMWAVVAVVRQLRPAGVGVRALARPGELTRWVADGVVSLRRLDLIGLEVGLKRETNGSPRGVGQGAGGGLQLVRVARQAVARAVTTFVHRATGEVP